MNHFVRTIVSGTALLSLFFTETPVAGQATVSHESIEWMDFGSTNIIGVEGNFLPGWTTLTGSPDLGQNLFFINTTSLSGSSTDAALWFLKFDPSHGGAAANESVELSLSGFTPGVQYQLGFFATLVYSSFASWNAQSDTLEISVAGADIASFSTTILTDLGDTDGLNVWVPQSLVFTAADSIVKFRFNDAPVSTDPALVARIGIDGLQMTQVPAPTAGFLFLGLSLRNRRRRDG